MRKVLLGTTAFVAASVVASGASAQSLEDRIRTLEESMLMGSPGSGFDVGVSGYMHGGFFLVDIDGTPMNARTNDAGAFDPTQPEEDYGSTDVKIGATEIHFTATGQLDNGIEVGGRVELEGTTQGDQIDETYIWAEGGFGRMVIGAENGPAYLMHYSAPWIAGVNGVDSPNYRYTVHGGAARTNTQTLIASDANKITYFTPRFSGFQFGIAYTPDNSDRSGEQNGWGSAFDRNGGEGVENIVAVAGNFSRDFGGVSVGASAGWESGSSTIKGDFNGDGTATGVSDDPTNWHIGGEVSRGGFTVGGAYYSATGFTGGAGTGGAIVMAGEGSDALEVDATGDTEQTAWAVGAHYATGPWGVGIAYLQAESDAPTYSLNDAGMPVQGTSNSLANSVIEIGASYEAGPGVTVAADIGFYEDDLPASDGTASQEAVGAGLVLGISF